MLESVTVQERIRVPCQKKEGEGKKAKICVVSTAEIQWLRHVTDQKVSSWGKDGEIAFI